jgi:DNA mismatch repair ATPase MutL
MTWFSSASASHPVGTTVRVQDFLFSIPVRKQTVLKASTKVLVDIRKLLYSYAFARPTVRLILKVLKGKNDKANWSYAPCKSNDDLASAAAKIIGTDVAGLCKQHAYEFEDDGDNSLTGYKINSLLLESDPNGKSVIRCRLHC